jgi:uncharacterized protein (DUF1919 family)
MAAVENFDIEIHFRNLDSRKIALESWNDGMKRFNVKNAKCIYVKADPTTEELDRLSKYVNKVLLVTNRETSYPYQVVTPTLTKFNEKTLYWLNGPLIRKIARKFEPVK